MPDTRGSDAQRIDPKWSDDAFLDELRRQGDPLADRTVDRLVEEHGIATVNRLFPKLHTDVDLAVADAPPALREFFDTTRRVPPGFDSARLERGAEAFREHALPAAVVMLASSLPDGYAAPCLSRILTMTGNLKSHPFRRLMGVLQMVTQVMSPGAGRPDSEAVMTARKLRLLHAGIRRLVPRHRPDYEARFGMPINHEDMLATNMGFSHLVIEGLWRLGLDLTQQEADDIWYLWRHFSLLVGIHPEGGWDDERYVPETRAEAAAFYDAYARRHFTGPEENPDGVELTRVNLAMMEQMIPGWLRLMGFRRAPLLAMQTLLGDEGMRRVGVEPDDEPAGWVAHLHQLLRMSQRAPKSLSHHFAAHLSVLLFQGMIDVARGGEVTFIVPGSLEDVRTQLV